MKFTTFAIVLAALCGSLTTGCSSACDDLDCSSAACGEATATVDKAVCDALIDQDDSDACDAYTGCGTK